MPGILANILEGVRNRPAVQSFNQMQVVKRVRSAPFQRPVVQKAQKAIYRAAPQKAAQIAETVRPTIVRGAAVASSVGEGTDCSQPTPTQNGRKLTPYESVAYCGRVGF
jgi:hypothetical protein